MKVSDFSGFFSRNHFLEGGLNFQWGGGLIFRWWTSFLSGRALVLMVGGEGGVLKKNCTMGGTPMFPPTMGNLACWSKVEYYCLFIELNLKISFNFGARLCFNFIWFVKLKIEIISI